MSSGKPYCEVQSLFSKLDSFQLRNISFSVEKGEYNVLLGPSGSGKTSLIKHILGFYHPDEGRIILAGRNISRMTPERRGVGYLPQEYRLFPHLTVEENIFFGLRGKRNASLHDRSHVEMICGMLGITGLRLKRVRNLSGGEKQRIALARALAVSPKLILLDEPFSSIDEGARRALWFELKRVIQEIPITVIHITHNLDEAYAIGERLMVMIDGAVAQHGERKEIFESPATTEVARFLGYHNIFRGRVERLAAGSRIDCGYFSIETGKILHPATEITLCIRPQDIKILREGVPVRDSLRRNVFRGTVAALFMMPEQSIMRFKLDGSPCEYDFEMRFPSYIVSRHHLSQGRKVGVAFWEPNIIFFQE